MVQPGHSLLQTPLIRQKRSPTAPRSSKWTRGKASAWYNRGGVYRDYKKAIADFSTAVKLDPKSAGVHNKVAWLLATCPVADLRDQPRALELAKKAVELKPTRGNYRNTLGVAFYRSADWKAAVHALNKSMVFLNGGDSFDWFFLAMAHWNGGNKDEARKWHDWAVQSMDKNQPNNAEPRRFRAEAEELLKTQAKKK